ncbi:MAG: bifunctional glutamate N-acetyltransferase/amino-acid acetyltransferase ArgJ [Caldilineae bacterium]|nr:MAG: bifunctional glutamate N-acetyltransferase/amino-acid acetyltransferase ArgJ [Caldilineae bacterium]
MSNPALPVPGFDAAGVHCGVKPTGALDLALIGCRVPCRAAAIFTRNAFPAAPVLYDRTLLQMNPEGIHGVIINSGNANACTGVQGRANARRMAEAAEQALGATDNTVFVMSTGVIGVQLPIEKVEAGASAAVAGLRPNGWEEAAEAIMTTDAYPKWASRQVEIDGVPVTITGIAKGAGMIHPNMATMLAVLATDAAVSQPLLQQALVEAANRSFNRISIDGDTSTNDTVLVLANGLAGNEEITSVEAPAYAALVAGLEAVSVELAKAIVRNGEGVTKFVTVLVEGAASDQEAHRAANAIATSPLVKTAFYGGDANWGRILCAVGYSGATVQPERANLFIASGEPEAGNPWLQLVEAGTPTDYAEADAAAIFAAPDITVRVELGLGAGRATVWTCDLSHEYVTINGEYRT